MAKFKKPLPTREDGTAGPRRRSPPSVRPTDGPVADIDLPLSGDAPAPRLSARSAAPDYSVKKAARERLARALAHASGHPVPAIAQPEGQPGSSLPHRRTLERWVRRLRESEEVQNTELVAWTRSRARRRFAPVVETILTEAVLSYRAAPRGTTINQVWRQVRLQVCAASRNSRRKLTVPSRETVRRYLERGLRFAGDPSSQQPKTRLVRISGNGWPCLLPAERGRSVVSDEPPADPATAKAWLLIRRLTATGIHVGGRRYQDPGLAAFREAGADPILVRVDPSDPSCIAVQEPSGRWIRIAACQGRRDRVNRPKG